MVLRFCPVLSFFLFFFRSIWLSLYGRPSPLFSANFIPLSLPAPPYIYPPPLPLLLLTGLSSLLTFFFRMSKKQIWTAPSLQSISHECIRQFFKYLKAIVPFSLNNMLAYIKDYDNDDDYHSQYFYCVIQVPNNPWIILSKVFEWPPFEMTRYKFLGKLRSV